MTLEEAALILMRFAYYIETRHPLISDYVGWQRGDGKDIVKFQL